MLHARLIAVFAAIPLGIGAQDINFLNQVDAKSALEGKALVFRRPSDGNELRWELKTGGYLFADNRSSGRRDSGNWEIRNDGALCTKFKGNSVESCSYFYLDQGTLKRALGKTADHIAKAAVVTLE